MHSLKFHKYCYEYLKKVLILELRKSSESFRTGAGKIFLRKTFTGGKLYAQAMNLLIIECALKMHISLQNKS